MPFDDALVRGDHRLFLHNVSGCRLYYRTTERLRKVFQSADLASQGGPGFFRLVGRGSSEKAITDDMLLEFPLAFLFRTL